MFRHAIACAALVALIGCSDASGPEEPTVAGRYALTSIRGQALPHVLIGTPDFSLAVTAATLQVDGSGSFSMSLTVRETDRGRATTSTESVTGSWKQTGSTISMTANGMTLAATWSGNSLSYQDLGGTWLYARQ